MDLIDDLLFIIFDLLPLFDLIKYRQVSKRWQRLINSKYNNKEDNQMFISQNGDHYHLHIISKSMRFRRYIKCPGRVYVEKSTFKDIISDLNRKEIIDYYVYFAWQYYLTFETYSTLFCIEDNKIECRMVNEEEEDDCCELISFIDISGNEIKLMKFLFHLEKFRIDK